jgi:exopolyphosphatase/guanosine-5'-triphosphate,3'-diphosphate pyrophosphatase
VREGILFDALSDEERLADPLIAATREAGSAQARFPANSDLLGEWIAGVFAGDPPEWQRIRTAACHLGDVAWRANPNFRAERGLELGLHGNWVGISGAEREMLGQALFTSFGGGNSVFKGGGTLAGAEATQRAIAWGLAMRLGQRFSGGTRKPLENSRLFVKDDHLVLEINTNHAALYGETVARRHRQLSNMLGLRSKMHLV